MKYCPACHSQYSDVTLRFCLQDGAVLQTSEAKQSTIDTVSFSNPVTAEKILKTGEMNLYAPAKEPDKTRKWRPEPPKSARREEPAKPKSSAKIWIAAVPVLLALVAVGLGGWIYFKSQTKETVRLDEPSVAATPEIAQNTPPANNSVSNVVLDEMSQSSNSNSNSELPANSGSEAVKKEIADAVELWRKAIESRKVPDYLSRYAEKVEYFDKTGASAADVRAEAQKMFDTYSDIDVTLTNVRVAANADGTQGTAVFDKEWSYQTAKDLLEGKARTKLQFQKTGKEWKIVCEKYQKVYYMEN